MADFQSRVNEWNVELFELSKTMAKNEFPLHVIDWACSKFSPESIFQTTAFGATGCVIVDLIRKKQKSIPLIFIDTLYHFDETLDLVKRIKEKYNVEIHVIKPLDCNSQADFEGKFGKELWKSDPDQYDFLVKAEPGHRAYEKLSVRAAFTGRRRTQGGERSNLPFLELDSSLEPPVVKVNPLADWDYDQVWRYIKENQVPYNALLDKGYKSIGDTHSTIPSSGGEREGRWAGQQKTECGLHKDYFKLKRAAQSRKESLKIQGCFNISQVIQVLEQHKEGLGSLQAIEYSTKSGIDFEIASALQISIPDSLFEIKKNNESLPSDTFIVTAIASVGITFGQFSSLVKLLPNIIRVKSLDSLDGAITVLEFEISLISKEEASELTKQLFEFGQTTKIDAIVQNNNIFRKEKRLVIFDMDSTLIQQEVIDELAREAGVYEKIAAITESAMRGEIDFNQSLRKRVGLLTGTPSSVIDKVKSRIQFTPGALELCKCLKRLGYKLAVLSGGFMPLALYVKATLGLDYAFANNLELSSDGATLTGNVTGSIVNGERKADLLRVISQLEGIPKNQIVAVGDGANDLLMLAESELGVAFNAKPKVQQQAKARINQPSLINILYLLGYSGSDILHLLRD